LGEITEANGSYAIFRQTKLERALYMVGWCVNIVRCDDCEKKAYPCSYYFGRCIDERKMAESSSAETKKGSFMQSTAFGKLPSCFMPS
jgi:hypothetical protein